jgi:hypothetical protein
MNGGSGLTPSPILLGQSIHPVGLSFGLRLQSIISKGFIHKVLKIMYLTVRRGPIKAGLDPDISLISILAVG